MNCVIFFYIVSAIILSLFVVGNSGQPSYVFKERIVQRITLASPEEYDEEKINYTDNYLTGLSSGERMRLCKSVYSGFKLPFINDDEYVFGSEVYRFTVSEDEDYLSVGIKCPTLPPVYLMYSTADQEKEKKITVLFVSPFVKRFSFDVEIVQKLELASSSEIDKCDRGEANASNSSSEEETETDLFYISPEAEDRWNLCFMATRRIHQRIRFLQQPVIAEPQSYKFNKGGIVTSDAIDCKTFPSMYLRVKIIDARNPVIKMMFVEADLKKSESELLLGL